ncbi:MAG TPA: cysteine peptidase family C39 domain-containing protein [bacterium]|jgi:hypothetical protein
MSKLKPTSFKIKSVKNIHPIVPIIILAIFGLLIYGGARFGIRAWAVYHIWDKPMNWDDDGVLIQATKYACVPTCIVMFLKDQGIETTVAEIAWISSTDNTGTSSEGIQTAANYYGFSVSKKHMNYEELMDENLPALVFFTWEDFLHAVYVIPNPEDGTLVIKNPAMGYHVINEELVMNYFGIDHWDCFLLEKNPD